MYDVNIYRNDEFCGGLVSNLAEFILQMKKKHDFSCVYMCKRWILWWDC
jgi:hypothetical protein